MTAPAATTTGNTTTTIPVPEPPKKTAAPTEYVILGASDKGEWFKQNDHIFARGGDAAVLQFLDAHPPKPDSPTKYVAIPARSWKPVKVTPQTVTTLKLEEAK